MYPIIGSPRRQKVEIVSRAAFALTSQDDLEIQNLVEGLFIHPSNLSVGIQLADMVAGAVWRKYERGDNKYYEMLKPSLRKDPQKQAGFGVVKFPKVSFV